MVILIISSNFLVSLVQNHAKVKQLIIKKQK